MNGRLRGRIGHELRQAILDTELAPPLKGFRVALTAFRTKPLLSAPVNVWSWCQFRGKKVILHGGGYTATIKRDAFKELVASNRRYRQARPTAEAETPAQACGEQPSRRYQQSGGGMMAGVSKTEPNRLR